MSERLHLDLFSGIGGFALAAQWAGYKTVAFCEFNSHCQEFLKKTWGLPVHDNVKTLDGKQYRGITLLTGGPPCQPASRAGDQQGEADDRWLWPDAIRIVAEARPAEFLFENPPGILDVGLDGIIADLERLGYEVGTVDLPACAVNSPQLRHRLWLVGFKLGDAKGVRLQQGRQDSGGIREGVGAQIQWTRSSDATDDVGDAAGEQRRLPGGQEWQQVPDTGGASGLVANTPSQGRERPDSECGSDGRCAEYSESNLADAERIGRERGSESEEARTDWSRPPSSLWQNSVWIPCADGKLRRAPDDSFGLVDGVHRSLLQALGNSIVPQVAYEILKSFRP